MMEAENDGKKYTDSSQVPEVPFSKKKNSKRSTKSKTKKRSYRATTKKSPRECTACNSNEKGIKCPKQKMPKEQLVNQPKKRKSNVLKKDSIPSTSEGPECERSPKLKSGSKRKLSEKAERNQPKRTKSRNLKEDSIPSTSKDPGYEPSPKLKNGSKRNLIEKAERDQPKRTRRSCTLKKDSIESTSKDLDCESCPKFINDSERNLDVKEVLNQLQEKSNAPKEYSVSSLPEEPDPIPSTSSQRTEFSIISTQNSLEEGNVSDIDDNEDEQIDDELLPILYPQTISNQNDTEGGNLSNIDSSNDDSPPILYPETLSTRNDMVQGNTSVIDDDDELPSPMYPETLPDKKVFERDDIVWMKSTKLYMPGVVIRSDKKHRKAKVKCINSPRNEKAYVKRFSDLLDFNNATRNSRLLEEGMKIIPGINAAYDKITEFWCLNLSSSDNLSAARYLTYDEGDRLYGVNLDDILKEEREANRVVETRSAIHEETTASINPDLPVIIPEENSACGYINKIIAQLSQNEIDELQKFFQTNQSLQHTIVGTQCLKHLKDVFEGRFHSPRHSAFIGKNTDYRPDLLLTSGLGPFSNDVGCELTAIIDNELKEMDPTDNISKRGRRNDYLMFVLLPEAIIYSLMKELNCTYEGAQRRFVYLSTRDLEL